MIHPIPIANKCDFYWEKEPHVLYDYLHFGLRLRNHIAETTSENPIRDDSTIEAYALVSTFREVMSECEDFAALLMALKRRFAPDSKCKYQRRTKTSETPLFFTLLNYRDLSLEKVLKEIKSPTDLFESFHFNRLIPSNISGFQSYDPAPVTRTLTSTAKAIYHEFLAYAKANHHLEAYNKIKHGALVLFKPKAIFPHAEDAPAVMIANENDIEPSHLSLNISPIQFNNLLYLLYQLSSLRSHLIQLYLWTHYHDFLRIEKCYPVPGYFLDDGLFQEFFRSDVGSR